MNIAEVYRHSMVIASDYRIPDPSRVGPLLEKRRDALAQLGAHHVLVYRSLHDEGRVLVMIGVRSREPVVELLRSRVFFEWFDAVGVEDIPAVFAGEIADRYDLTGRGDDYPPGVLVSTIVSVENAALFVNELHSAKARFKAAGVRKVWVFKAFDDSHEVLVLQDIDNEENAERWIGSHDVAPDWMEDVGVGVYPPVFLGEFVSMMRIGED
ncbi:fatty-acid--CoA ligase [Mycobacterium sp. ACS4331]|uniref:fatty-acid--CoA ligase n=1 Tax=Mycobacterium sp. ACS4331 TaxID=1834121 RepID=UPI0007FC0DFE|nr:fatty-acid--CoA ligase [Mycobacterium sp. ACS4331]OBF18511.1 fatty-acid--CoA ligase [Mycobacterium sp. ACS4331]